MCELLPTAHFEALKEHQGNRHIAENIANNDLTRAGLRRFDEAMRIPEKQLKRDRELREMEEGIIRRLKSQMSPDELEQVQLLEGHEKRAADFWKKRGK